MDCSAMPQTLEGREHVGMRMHFVETETATDVEG